MVPEERKGGPKEEALPIDGLLDDNWHLPLPNHWGRVTLVLDKEGSYVDLRKICLDNNWKTSHVVQALIDRFLKRLRRWQGDDGLAQKQLTDYDMTEDSGDSGSVSVVDSPQRRSWDTDEYRHAVQLMQAVLKAANNLTDADELIQELREMSRTTENDDLQEKIVLTLKQAREIRDIREAELEQEVKIESE